MNVLVACEFSGVVRDAFVRAGHYAISCDLLASETYGHHFQGDFKQFLLECHTQFDILIAHPPCTHLSVSGARHFARKRESGEQQEALDFVRWLMDLSIPKICIENPISIISSQIRKPEQIIQPWQFGHGETKATCLWLKGLPKLTSTNIVLGREARIHKMPPSKTRAKDRSRTYQGIADGMATQWGNL